jgi:tRNA uridine 5-carboxymethylaminomethyl modification enzyme
MDNTVHNFDVVIIGAGHAGVEAAYAAARRGSRTALVTLTEQKIGYMPCNPAIGGIGKGHIVFEIAALGGLMPELCTKTYLQVRMLNTTKGPAVHGLRLQIDKNAYSKESQRRLKETPNLTIIEAMAEELIVDDRKVIHGVRLADGRILNTPTVVLTTGTFLNGLVHVGLENYPSGREDEKPVIGLTKSLRDLGLTLGRLKTGTPPRLLRSSLDFTKMVKQESDTLDYLFEFYPHTTSTKLDCYITHTNERVHDIIKKNAHLSRILRKEISGIGPRYCPSIEDKITRFPHKTSHQIFVEPESLTSDWIYPNGLSTSLPLEAQTAYIQAIQGFEEAVIVRAGYAIEYDFVLPHQLKQTLEVKSVPGLFLAGQINGTTGYEEAAGQGIIAGINASLTAAGEPPFIMDRTEGYIGVMIDDLTTLSVDEPYRMFTSRAEHRLTLRQDNAFLRLTQRAYDRGLIPEQFYQDFITEKKQIDETLHELKTTKTHAQLIQGFADNTQPQHTVSLFTGKKLSPRACQTIQAAIKYAPYIEREEVEVQKLKKYQTMRLPLDFDYLTTDGLSIELRQKLTRHKPETIAQASIIPGMTPAALSLLILKIKILQK